MISAMASVALGWTLLAVCFAGLGALGLRAAAVHGLGIAVQPTFIAGEAIGRGDLVPVLTEVQWPVTPAWAVYPPTRHLSYRVREFIDFLAEYFSGTPYWDEDCGPDCASP